MTTSEPLVIAAMRALQDAWPAALDFQALLGRALTAVDGQTPRELVAARLRAVLLQAYLARVVVLQSSPPPLSSSPGECPHAGPLARAQAAAGAKTVSSLLHANARLEGDLEPALLPLLDGTHDHEDLLAELATRSIPVPPGQLDEALERIASLGLLLAGPD